MGKVSTAGKDINVPHNSQSDRASQAVSAANSHLDGGKPSPFEASVTASPTLQRQSPAPSNASASETYMPKKQKSN